MVHIENPRRDLDNTVKGYFWLWSQRKVKIGHRNDFVVLVCYFGVRFQFMCL